MSSPAALEVLAVGALASIQDFGRRGWRRAGVPWSGVLDPRLMRIANRLVTNAEDAPVIECFDGGQQFRASGAGLCVALAGDAELEVDGDQGRRKQAAWCSFHLDEGEILRIRAIRGGRIAILALRGLAVAHTLGSASTYMRAQLGGIDGRALASGMHLPAVADFGGECLRVAPPQAFDGPIRAVAGPQADHFTAAALAAFWNGTFRVSTDADRMGVRLQGPLLQHCGAVEILSDATVPGSVQVPGNGQPIVLLADAQTAGGYPKIATVIGADLARLAAARPGSSLRFAEVDALEAERIARSEEAATVELLASIRKLPSDGIDLAALYAHNLVDGVVDARAPDAAADGAIGAHAVQPENSRR